MTIDQASEKPAPRRCGLARLRRPGLERSDAAPLRPRPWLTGAALCLRFKRLTQLGWPRNFPIVQFPNAPLIIAFLAGEAAKHTHGSIHADASAISYLAMTIWAYEELVHGVNWFRHLLGLTYVISTALHLALALQH
jgi:hypothetical protein